METSKNDLLRDQRFDAIRAERDAYALARPKEVSDGVAALQRLVAIAKGNSGQCRHVAAFLLSLYNGRRFKYDLSDFRAVDHTIFVDCLAVLKLDAGKEQAIHLYVAGGEDTFEAIAADWCVPDRHKLREVIRNASFTGPDSQIYQEQADAYLRWHGT